MHWQILRDWVKNDQFYYQFWSRLVQRKFQLNSIRPAELKSMKIGETWIPIVVTNRPDADKRLFRVPAAARLFLPSLCPFRSLFQIEGRSWEGKREGERDRGGVGEGTEKRKLSPNCHIYKALPARRRFPLFNLTHTASCLLKPCKALWSSASWAERTLQPRERGVGGKDGETEKEKIAHACVRGGEKGTVFICSLEQTCSWLYEEN